MMRILTALAIVIIFCTCNMITGSGNIITSEKHLDEFNGVKSSGSIDVEVSNHDSPGVRIEADDNIIPYVITTVQDGILNVHLKSNLSYRNINVKVYVGAPSIKRLYVSGSGSIISLDTLQDDEQIKFSVSGSGDIKALVDAPMITAEVSGSGSLTLGGRTRDLKCTVAGSGDLKCRELLSENTKVTVGGSGTAHVFASVNLDAKVGGSGDIYYSGNPSSPVIHKSGSGSVRKER